jgi:hypothetical protein
MDLIIFKNRLTLKIKRFKFQFAFLNTEFYKLFSESLKMVDLNLPNAVTVGIIAVLAILVLRFALKAVGMASPV